MLVGLDRLQTHQHIAIAGLQRLALGHHAADIILLGRHHAAKAEIAGVVVPLSSPPATWPFSMRMIDSASMP